MAIHTIKTEAVVGEDHRLVIQLPAEVPTGTHEVVAVVSVADHEAPTGACDEPFPVLEGTTWPEGMTVNREDLYDYRD